MLSLHLRLLRRLLVEIKYIVSTSGLVVRGMALRPAFIGSTFFTSRHYQNIALPRHGPTGHRFLEKI